jgi:hypothetical protein
VSLSNSIPVSVIADNMKKAGWVIGSFVICASLAACANDPFASRAYVHDDVERGEFLDSMHRRCNG